MLAEMPIGISGDVLNTTWIARLPLDEAPAVRYDVRKI